MTGKFQYSVLKYRHSYIAGEVFNIGIIFLFNNGKIEFRHPHKLSRLAALFQKSPISFLKNTLTSFKSKSRSVSRNNIKTELFKSDLGNIISDYFLIESAGALFFDEVKTGVFLNNENQIIDHYYSLYLGHYEDEVVPRKNEKYIIDRVKHIIKDQFSPEVESKLKVNRTLHDPNGNFDETFEYGWQNGKLNLITPIGFDLASEQTFEAKALKWYGILNFLKQPALEEKINFDILLTEPTDISLKSSYFKARDIIERSEAPLKFVEEHDFKKYLKHAVEVVIEHETE